MHKKMTITLDAEVYDALHRVIGKGKISQFIENLARPHVLQEDLATAYRAMAADAGERDALEWCEELIGDVGNGDRENY